jgi:3-deoxy-D-manno-octulosonate 8-phosphate phosphatase (KDO 8-P phosphatase)
MDCDGVLTDGRLYFSERGEELKVFHVRDGQGLVSWHAAGFESGIISGRDTRAIVDARAVELGIKYVRVKSINKLRDLEAILAEAKLEAEQVAFIGDDIGDIELMKVVGFAVAVADAMPEVKEAAHYVTEKFGGYGAVREITDLLLKVHQKL